MLLADRERELVNLERLKKNSPSPTTGRINRRPKKVPVLKDEGFTKKMTTWEEMIGEDRLKDIFAKDKLRTEAFNRLDDNKKSEIRERWAREDAIKAIKDEEFRRSIDEGVKALQKKDEFLKSIREKGKKHYVRSKAKAWQASTKTVGKGITRSKKKTKNITKKRQRKRKINKY